MLLSLAVFFLAVVIHEFAHGFCAYKLGDPTAKYAGRLTLNPLAHIDPIGTILLPAMLMLMRAPIIFGWAKPVPINFWNFKHKRIGMALTGLAGPAANFLLALLLTLLLKSGIFPPNFNQILQLAIVLNLALCVFNLIPIPPLDGSRVLLGLLPQSLVPFFASMEQFGFVILFMLLWIGLTDYIVWPAVILLIRLLGVY